MAIVTQPALLSNLRGATSPFTSRDLTHARALVTLSAGLLAADSLEFLILPAGCKINYFELRTASIAAVATFDVGFLTGTPFDFDTVRTQAAVGEIINDGAKNVTIKVDATFLDLIPAVAADRAIGVKISASEAPGAGVIHAVMEYYATVTV